MAPSASYLISMKYSISGGIIYRLIFRKKIFFMMCTVFFVTDHAR